MAIFHYKLLNENQNIDITSEIHAQSFMVRRIIVQIVPDPGTNPTTSLNKGGVVVVPSHLSGLEIVSGNLSNSNEIMIAYNEHQTTSSIYYDMEFESENIPRSFNVKTYKFDSRVPAVFAPRNSSKPITATQPSDNLGSVILSPAPPPGSIISIDLFFQFESLFNYESY